MLVALVMACGGDPSETAIAATVEARLNEERVAEATVEARVELAKAVPTIPTPALTRKHPALRKH